ncbi:MAG: MFS transporter [Thermomicrobiales bacterium]
MQNRAVPPAVWRNAAFQRIFTAQLLAELGAQISFLAVPLVASTLLGASPLQMGMLTATNALPPLLLGLHAGVFIDRRPKRPILLATDIARMALIGVAPIAWLGGWLSLNVLIAVSLAIGACSLLFQIAYQAFLPTILPRDVLLRANSTLELSRTAAELAGPGISGWLIGLVSAPGALLANAATYLGSALVLKGLPSDPAPVPSPSTTSSLRQDIRAGITVLLNDPGLRAMTIGGALLEFFNAMIEALLVLFVTRTLGLHPATIGVIFTVGGLGFALGAFFPDRIARTVGVGKATILALALVGLSDLIVPFAHGPLVIVVIMLVIAQFAFGVGLIIFKVNRATVRQALVPMGLQGRATATMRVASASLIPIGALAGGIAGAGLGLRETLVLAALGELGAVAWLLRTPFSGMTRIDDNAANAASSAGN